MGHVVLLVDDDPNLLSALRRALREEPYRIRTETSPRRALELVAAEEVHAVVSDHDMPEMKGTELLAEVHRVAPSTVRFVLTGKPDLDMAMDAINRGAVQRFFTKPCRSKELALGLRQALQEKDLIDEARRLLWKARQQRSQLDELERKHPGITHIERDEGGAIVLEELPNDPEDLIREMQLF